MKNMIRASFYKLFHDKATWISLAGTAVWSLYVCVMLTWIADGKLDVSDAVGAEKYWRDFMGYHGVMVPLLISSIVLFTSEFKDKSWKLFVARGIPRAGYYFSKLPCILTLTVMLSFVAIAFGAAYGVAKLGMQCNGVFVILLIRYFLLQTVAHGTAAVLILTIFFLIKIGEVSASVNAVLLMFGTMALSKIETALSLGDALTGAFAFAQPLRVSFSGADEWVRILIVFVAYFVACSLAVLLLGVRGDVE
ncbi:MAG: ABC transporter permease [Lachnospiraceae bacterium]|nr:ABC transporter permease [Lachnospiraceae bacterium]